MSIQPTAKGTYLNGRVELDSPIEWVDGLRVAVVPLTTTQSVVSPDPECQAPQWGIAEADYQDTVEFRSALIRQMDAFEPVEFSPAEVAEWEAARRDFKQYTLEAVRKEMGL